MGNSSINKDEKSYACPGEDKGFNFEEVEENEKQS